MIFHNGKNADLNDFNIVLDNVILPRVDKVKFLGVYLDSSLSWKYHIHEVESKVSKNIGIISRLKHLLPNHILRMLYCALILPYFSYCNLVWANSCKYKIQKLILLQKKIIRIISGMHYRSHTGPIFKQIIFLKFSDINLHQQGIFMYKSMNNIFPSQFSDFINFKCNSETHTYNTRSAANIRLPKHRTRRFQFDIRYSGPKFWNTLPSILHKSLSLQTFSRKAKIYLIARYWYPLLYLCVKWSFVEFNDMFVWPIIYLLW